MNNIIINILWWNDYNWWLWLSYPIDHSIIPVLPRDCSGTVPALSQYCPGIGPALYQYCSSTVPALSQYCPGPISVLSRYWSVPVPVLSQYCPGAIPVLSLRCPSTVPALSQCWWSVQSVVTICSLGIHLIVYNSYNSTWNIDLSWNNSQLHKGSKLNATMRQYHVLVICRVLEGYHHTLFFSPIVNETIIMHHLWWSQERSDST